VKRSFAILLAAAALAAGCAPIPRPSVLAEAEQVSHGAAATEAEKYAHGAFEHAEKLRREANEAFDAKDIAGAQLLGERSLAAFAHALALARIARAEGGAAEADAHIASTKAELAGLEAEEGRVAA
jgi:hypothetical protein